MQGGRAASSSAQHGMSQARAATHEGKTAVNSMLATVITTKLRRSPTVAHRVIRAPLCCGHECGAVCASTYPCDSGIAVGPAAATLVPFVPRKTLALTIVLVVSSLAPTTAILGFCAKMPCCFGETEERPALATNMPDCCSTINCYEVPPHELAAAGKAKTFTVTTLATPPVAPATPQVSIARPLTSDDTSPPRTTSERLSTLSIFLI
jgi:hypothetical protein